MLSKTGLQGNTRSVSCSIALFGGLKLPALSADKGHFLLGTVLLQYRYTIVVV